MNGGERGRDKENYLAEREREMQGLTDSDRGAIAQNLGWSQGAMISTRQCFMKIVFGIGGQMA